MLIAMMLPATHKKNKNNVMNNEIMSYKPKTSKL